MRISDRIEGIKLVAGIACIGAAWMLTVIPGIAQEERSGVAHPDSSVITADPAETVTPPAKPSAAIPAATPATSQETVYGPYVPYRAPGTPDPASAVEDKKAFDPDANIVTNATAGRDEHRLLINTGSKTNPDGGIVTYVPSRPGEIPDGTLLRAKLREDLSTLTTQPGSPFSAEVTEPVMRDGKVIVPVGSVLDGRVTWVRGGKRIGGAAAIHLEPRTVTLPDGAQYILRARVIDTNSWDDTKVDNEGTIMRRDYGKRTASAIGLAAGGTMAAGAMIGGVPGAVIGAGVGAGVGTVVWLKQDRQAELPKDLGLIFSLTEPMSVTPTHASVAAEGVSPGGN